MDIWYDLRFTIGQIFDQHAECDFMNYRFEGGTLHEKVI